MDIDIIKKNTIFFIDICYDFFDKIFSNIRNDNNDNDNNNDYIEDVEKI